MLKMHPEDYNIFPKTWLLPTDLGDLKGSMEKSKKRHTYIVKPEASCQGRGIFLAWSIEDFNGKENDHYVVQKYLDKPFLIENLKFDLRIYVIVTGMDPMRIYMSWDGLAWFATE